MNPNATNRHVILLTKEGGNNHYWDTTFNLRPSFHGNFNGQFKITVNEAHFNNTEPFIKKDDFYQFTLVTTANYKFVWRVNVLKDFYLYRQGTAEWTDVIQLLKGTLKTPATDEHGTVIPYRYTYEQTIRERYNPNGELEHTYASNDTSFNMTVDLVNDDGSGFGGSNRGVNPLMFYDVHDIVFGEPPADSGVASYGDLKSITLTYSWGFVYILNNRADLVEEIKDEALKPTRLSGHHYFEFCNLRLGGPYLYILDMPTVKTEVMTMNEVNQAFNLTGVVKNVADNHNENVQFISSMEGRVNSFTNFRVRLLDDNFEPVRIRSPLYLQFTISNDD